MSTRLPKAKTSRSEWLAVVALVMIVVLAGAWYLLTRGGELSVVVPGRAASLLARVEEAAELPVRQRSAVERSGPDGPMPEIAGRELVVDANAPAIRSRVLGACRSLGLSPAAADRRALEPEVLCDGGQGHSGDSVHLRLSCRDSCTAYIQTQVVGF